MNFKFNEYPMRKIRTLFIFTLLVFAILSNLYAENTQCVWTGVERIVAVGDLHGDYGSFLDILKATKLIDEDLHWKGGKTHLVQIGDIFDRGTQAKRILDFLITLEREAEEAGGKIHVLIGNHEMMNIAGIAFDRPGYIPLEQLVDFLPDEYREKTEMKFREKLGENSPRENNSDYSFDPTLKSEWLKFLDEVLSNRDHKARREYSQNLIEKYGEWLTNKNAVIKINDIIFVHGGVSEKYSKRKLEDINKDIQKELNLLASEAIRPFPRNTRARISFDADGPLWHRDLALEQEEYMNEEVDRILGNLKAKYMVIAHTPRVIIDKRDMSRFKEKIWIIDTGNSSVYTDGRQSALIIENGKFDAWLGNPRKSDVPSSEFTPKIQEGTWISDIENLSFLNAMSGQK